MSIWKRLIHEANCYFHRNSIILNNPAQKTATNSVNVHWYRLDREDVQNLGDYLSPFIVEKCVEYWSIDCTRTVRGIRHLYAVGSILAHGFQDATVWGSGLLNGNTKKHGCAFICRNLMFGQYAVRSPERFSLRMDKSVRRYTEIRAF